MSVYKSAAELIGNTPLLELCKTKEELTLCANVFAKLEAFNPAGSAKDRVALKMIRDAMSAGLINENTTIIEPTSGNTGIGLAMMGAILGLKTVIVMPDSMSPERIKIMRAYGADVVLTPGALGMDGAIAKAKELADSLDSAFIPDQFSNPSNAAAHFETTGPEIFDALGGKVDVFVAGVGTGGTITGVGKYLKEKDPSIEIVAVEPSDSAVLSGGEKGAHALQGIGAGFIPKVLDTSVYDRVITVTKNEAFTASRELAKREGVLVGISSGAALHAALNIASDPVYKDKNVVVLLTDTGERYLSGELFE